MKGIYLKSLSYPYSFGRFIFLELPKVATVNIQPGQAIVSGMVKKPVRVGGLRGVSLRLSPISGCRDFINSYPIK